MVLRISGLATGIDIDKWVTDLMKAHRAPLDRVRQDRQLWQWRQEDYRAMNTSLLSLRSEVFNLKLQGTFQVKTVTSSDPQVVTASAGSSAAATTYQVKVERLASAATNASAAAITATSIDPGATLASQQASFTNGLDSDFGWDPATHEFSFTINGQNFSFDGDTATLNSVMAAVNASTGAGVSMFYDPSTRKVAIATTRTGDYNPGGPEILLSGSFLTSVLQLDENNEQGGEDASFEINGLSGMTSHDNSYTANGVTFKFTGTTAGGFGGAAATVTVAQDVDRVVNSIKSFVDRYNEVVAAINGKLSEERYRDYRPLTDEQVEEGKLTDAQIDAWTAKARSGLLKNDSILQSALSSMRQVLSSSVAGLTGQITVQSGTQSITTTADNLSKIGITASGSYQENGRLYLNEDRLREALQSNPQAVMELFTRTSEAAGEKGIAVQLYDSINAAISRITAQAGSSSSLVDNSNIGRTIRQIDERIDTMEERLEELEDRYYRQFTAMETAISRLNSQSAWLAQQFGGGGTGQQ
jgi:flagellar hook-associated protein 2